MKLQSLGEEYIIKGNDSKHFLAKMGAKSLKFFAVLYLARLNFRAKTKIIKEKGKNKLRKIIAVPCHQAAPLRRMTSKICLHHPP